MSDANPSKPVVETRPKASSRISAVWLVPLLALVVSLGVAYQSYSSRGPLIEIEFEAAAGIVPEETKLRYKNIVVGAVEDVDFGPDLASVIVSVRLDKEIATYVDTEATFWLVSAQVGPRGISGLDTVLSGAYIAGNWDAAKGTRQTHFVALEEPPLTSPDEPGTRIRLRAPHGGSMASGAPVLFRQIPVGKIEKVDLTDAGEVMLTAFINAPNDTRLTTRTRFWNASGFSIDLTAQGASLNVESLASLIQGGISFDTVVGGGEPVGEDQIFDLYPSETDARNASEIEESTIKPVVLGTVFEGMVDGLEVGSDVTYRGTVVGRVQTLQARVVTAFDGPAVEMYATLALRPGRMGITDIDDAEAQLMELLQAEVSRGLRAQLRSTGLLSKTLVVDLVQAPDAPSANITMDDGDYPLFPSIPASPNDILTSAENVVERVAALPIEEVVETVLDILTNANALIGSKELRAAPKDLAQMIASARGIVDSDAIQNVPTEVATILEGVRLIVEEATQQELVASLAGAVEDARAAITSVETATSSLPGLLAEIEGVAGDARALPLNELVSSATGLLEGVNELVRDPNVAAIPADLQSAVAEIRLILSELREGGAIGNVNATLASTRSVIEELAAAKLAQSITAAVDAANEAVANVQTATADLPRITEDAQQLVGKINDLPLEDLVNTANNLLISADAFVSSEGVEALPPRLSATLDEISAILAELREGGAIENVNKTLASADAAAGAIAEAAKSLPQILARMNRIATQADNVLASIEPGSTINREVITVLTEARDAARAVTSLATALERRPNSVLFGR